MITKYLAWAFNKYGVADYEKEFDSLQEALDYIQELRLEKGVNNFSCDGINMGNTMSKSQLIICFDPTFDKNILLNVPEESLPMETLHNLVALYKAKGIGYL